MWFFEELDYGKGSHTSSSSFLDMKRRKRKKKKKEEKEERERERKREREMEGGRGLVPCSRRDASYLHSKIVRRTCAIKKMINE